MPTNKLYDACGGRTAQYPQMTIYDSLDLDGVDFGLFVNSTCGLPRVISDCHFRKTATEYDRKTGIKWLSCTAK